MLKTYLRVKLIVKNSDDILLIKKAKDENAAAIRHLEMQIDRVDKEIEKAKETVKDEKDKAKTRFKSDSCVNKIDCRLCEKSFTRYVDLENHIESCHEKPREFQCDQCDKNFLLKWRLRKHMRLHEENNIKHCHYFNNAKSCPYEKLGCKFFHTVVGKYELRSKCTRRLCPFRHEEIQSTRNESDDMIDDSEMDDNDNFPMNFDSFVTSTPQEKSIQCEDCANRTQCTD